MQQLLSIWENLDPRRRIIVIAATIAMFLAVLGLARIASQPSMALLYAGLESGAAGDVVQALEARGAVYEIRGTAIFVNAAQRDELRMTLAGEGLPANAGLGYELLDNLSGFGTTAQMFDAAYWRAKEGELARTIMSSPQIKTARVHLGNPTGSGFARQSRATASVSVTTTGAALNPAQARALKYLVASAVSGLSPEDVSIIDGRGGLMAGDDSLDEGGAGTDRAAALRRNVERLLEARVGYGNAIVELSIETETDREQIFERRFDPEGRVAVSSEVEERTTASNDSRNSAVTVASNLPDGDGAQAGSSSAQDSETRERVNYELSETKREITRAPGAIKRLSVAVLLDGIRRPDPVTGETVWEARSDGELATLRELVASAVGFDETRGDTLTIKTLELEQLPTGDEISAPGLFGGLQLNPMTLIQLGVLALVTLVLGLFVLRPILASTANRVPALGPPDSGPLTNPQPLPVSMIAPQLPALNGEIDDGEFIPPPMGMVADFDIGDDLPSDPVARLRKMIDTRQDETIEILRSWMDEKEESA